LLKNTSRHSNTHTISKSTHYTTIKALLVETRPKSYLKDA